MTHDAFEAEVQRQLEVGRRIVIVNDDGVAPREPRSGRDSRTLLNDARIAGAAAAKAESLARMLRSKGQAARADEQDERARELRFEQAEAHRLAMEGSR